MKQIELENSYLYCQQVARSQARNFYYGMKLTPEPRRSALYALYVWMRAADDLADQDLTQSQYVKDAFERSELIERFREQTRILKTASEPALPDQVIPLTHAGGAVDHKCMWPAVQHAFQTYHMPMSYLDGLIDGQLMDQDIKIYPTFREVHDYCYKVASLVGLCCIQIWGLEAQKLEVLPEVVKDLAIRRGLALQLTNIIRDVVEDASRGRVYIPQDELRQCGFTTETFMEAVLSGKRSFGLSQLLAYQIKRAKHFYETSSPLESHINQACRPTCWSIMRIYFGLYKKIEKKPTRILLERVRLSTLEKLRIGILAMMR